MYIYIYICLDMGVQGSTWQCRSCLPPALPSGSNGALGRPLTLPCIGVGSDPDVKVNRNSSRALFEPPSRASGWLDRGQAVARHSTCSASAPHLQGEHQSWSRLTMIGTMIPRRPVPVRPPPPPQSPKSQPATLLAVWGQSTAPLGPCS